MPHGLVRYQRTGDQHFVTFSCFQRHPLLGSASARCALESALEKVRTRYRFLVIGYVVMPEHVHLLVTEPERALLSTAIQAIKISTARRCTRLATVERSKPMSDPCLERRETWGARLWQARYYDFNVFTERKRAEKLDYIHFNPVARGLVTRPEDWEWSSFRHYQTGETGRVGITSRWNTNIVG
jgi:putative transposase